MKYDVNLICPALCDYGDGCFLASYCAKAWEDKGITSEAATTTYSKSYLPFESCN